MSEPLFGGWINEKTSSGGGGDPLLAEEAVILITATITPGTAIDISTPDRGTAIALPGSSAAFTNNPYYQIYFNGVSQENNTTVLWVSPTQLSLTKTARPGNYILIRKLT